MNITEKIEKYLHEQGSYEDFFEKMLKKYGVKSPSELDKEKKKKFFDEIDKNWTSKKE